MRKIRVLVVCRHNQARSIAIGALLRNLFPELTVETAGIESEPGRPIPQITSDVCESWGLSSYDRYSNDMSRFEDLDSFDEILAADYFIYSSLSKSVVNSKLTLLTDYSTSDFLNPIDPRGLNPEEFATELAKAAVLTIRWAKKLLGLQIANIESFLLQSDHSVNVFMEVVKQRQIGVFVDTNLERPNVAHWQGSDFEVIKFNANKISTFEFEKLTERAKFVLVSSFETDRSERLLLSAEWRDFLGSLSKAMPVSLVSRATEVGVPKHVGILALAHSSATTYLS